MDKRTCETDVARASLWKEGGGVKEEDVCGLVGGGDCCGRDVGEV